MTIAGGVPTVWLPLLDYLRSSGRSSAPLNRTVIGGSACPLAMIEEFRGQHGVAVLHGWGMTEMSPVGVVNRPTSANAHLSGAELANHVVKQGRALPGVELKVTVEGGELRVAQAASIDNVLLPEPQRPPAFSHHGSYNILVTGVGGTGVVTIGNILGMAAHLEGRHLSVLDQTGLAQKYDAVRSHIQIADDAARLRGTRITDGGADLVLGADLVTAASRDGMRRLAPDRSHVLVDTDAAVVSAFTRDGDLDFGSGTMLRGIADTIGRDRVHGLAANALATRLLGDAIGANLMLVGHAYQCGFMPMSATALERAIAINAVKVEFNIRAFHLGRLLAHDPARSNAIGTDTLSPALEEMPLAQLIARRAAFLGEYQNAAYGARYRALLGKVASAERACIPSAQELTRSVAQVYFQLLAYKDEYEVARLYTESGLLDRLRAQCVATV